MNVLVIGASGLVGRHLVSEGSTRGHVVTGTYFDTPQPGMFRLPLSEPALAGEVLARTDPDIVICAAAWVWADGCERDPAYATRINAEAPAAIAKLCFACGTRFAFISSNYVFDGTAAPYAEDALPSPINHYGVTKLIAEMQITEVMRGNALIIRTCGVYGEDTHGKNFLYQIVRSLRRGEPIRVPCDQFQNATHALDLAAGIYDLIAAHESGIWNLAGPDPSIRRDNLARKIAQAYQLDESLIQPVETIHLGQRARRPLACGLRIDKAVCAINFAPSDQLVIPALAVPPETPAGGNLP